MTELSLRYVALGDSTGAGVGAREGGGYVERLFQRLRKTRPGVGLLNLCVPGATSATARSSQLPRAVSAKPQLFTLCIGGNDLWRGVPAATYEENLESLVSALVGTGARGVLCNIPDLSLAPVARTVPPEMYEGRFQVLNSAIRRVGAQYGVRVVDIFTASQREIPTHPEFFCPDGFHPSSEGYAFWAELAWPPLLAAADESIQQRAPRSA